MYANAPGFGTLDTDTFICFTLWVLNELKEGREINFIDFDSDFSGSNLPLEWLNNGCKEEELLEGSCLKSTLKSNIEDLKENKYDILNSICPSFKELDVSFERFLHVFSIV